MRSNYYDPYIAQYIRPKQEFKVKLKDADKDFVFDRSKSDLNKFDKIIDELEQRYKEQSDDPRKQIDLIFQAWRL